MVLSICFTDPQVPISFTSSEEITPNASLRFASISFRSKSVTFFVSGTTPAVGDTVFVEASF